jgi:hypothetical protein
MEDNMQRQEMLRQIDQDLDKLKAQAYKLSGDAEDLAYRIQKFKEEEKQRVPKWAKPKKYSHEYYFTSTKWYKMEDVEQKDNLRWVWHSRDNSGSKLRCWEKQDICFGVQEWELCYDENPPEEQKADAKGPRILNSYPKEKLKYGDIVIWVSGILCSYHAVADMVRCGVTVGALDGYPKTLAIRPK